jgi:hypothetical protein
MTSKQNIELTIKTKFNRLLGTLNERSRRMWAATEADSLGRGGLATVCRATGLDHKTVQRGLSELDNPALPVEQIRKAGGGRKSLAESDPKILADLETLVEPLVRGDPESRLRWVAKSTYRLAEELKLWGHKVSQRSVSSLLLAADYSQQANAKVNEGRQSPDRNAQFEHINSQAIKYQSLGQPVISVDAKKKELIGNFKNNGKEWRLKGQPRKVNVYDFIDKDLGKVAPYGVYDLSRNEGWVNVGIDHDTAQFAVESIRVWWKEMGRARYPKAKEILITADGGGSNSSRTKLWKLELQKLANELNLDFHVCHFPPGTSKWNKIEHKLFSFISQNWKGQPLTDRATVVNLIASTTTKQGLTVKARLDTKAYPKGIKVSDKELKTINLQRDAFHGDWNYTIKPNGNTY